MVIGVAVFGLLPFCHLIVASSVVVEGAAEGGFCHFRKGIYLYESFLSDDHIRILKNPKNPHSINKYLKDI